MKKIFTLSLIFFLVLITSIVKNSTKKIDDKIFTLKENIFNLNSELKDMKLEFDYLSSSEKLLEYQNQYFEKELNQKSIDKINIINFSTKDTSIQNISIINNNGK
ncbi:cell division protein FtsL [Pelagibacterales bacterium SAG-MED13]|nr:cell division protein FtsL [Pelagibacterales bacterium SAG-MED13]